MVAAGRGWLAIVAMPEQSDSAAGAFQAMSSTADRDTRDTAPPRRCIPPSPSIPHRSGNYQGMFSHKQQAEPSALLLPLHSWVTLCFCGQTNSSALMNGGLLKKHKKLKQKTIYTMIKQIFRNIEEKLCSQEK